MPPRIATTTGVSRKALYKVFSIALTAFMAVAIAAPGFYLKTTYARPMASEVEVPLTYVGRSLESAGGVVSTGTIGTSVAAALALPLANPVVFDNGTVFATPNVPAGNQWASWPQYPNIPGVQLRHIQATFTLPPGLTNISDVILYSPYYPGNLIPLNDNVYAFLNGTQIGVKGTFYGATNGGKNGTSAIGNETDGWYQNGSFGTLAGASLQPGVNTLDLVVEETALFGGLGKLNLKLVGDLLPQEDPPPVVTNCSTNKTSLWPPNHKYVDVTVNYTVTGGAAPVNCVLTVTSNEPINGLGDGDTAPDWVVVDAHKVKLRAERSGTGNGRIYTITITCTDANGLSSSCSVNVGVPHDQGK